MDDDLNNEPVDFAELRKQLEAFKRQNTGELLLAPIEKWMVKKLGVERLGLDGIIVIYRHYALAEIHGDETFTVHLIHGKRREMILYCSPLVRNGS